MRVHTVAFGFFVIVVFATAIALGMAFGAWQTTGSGGSGSGGGRGGGHGARGGEDLEGFVLPSSEPAASQYLAFE